jgi:hypothetical protein
MLEYILLGINRPSEHACSKKLHTFKTICKAVCLPSRHWQFQDFSGMIVALILIVDPMFLRPIYS